MDIVIGILLILAVIGFLVWGARIKCPMCGNYWAWGIFGGTRYTTYQCSRCKLWIEVDSQTDKHTTRPMPERNA